MAHPEKQLTEVFAFGPLESVQRTRVSAIESVLHGTPDLGLQGVTDDYFGLRYAIDHHLIEGAERAARAGRETEFAWYRRGGLNETLSRSVQSSVGRRLVVAPGAHRLMSSTLSETPFYLLEQEDVRADQALTALTVSALDVGAREGFRALLTAHAGVICLLSERCAGDYLESWTISRLPGTIFLDYLRSRFLLARDLIHEAGHNWLNDAIFATKAEFNEGEGFYSPWKRTVRPTYGFLHACWAFSLTMIYAKQVSRYARGPVGDVLSAYRHRQTLLLRETRKTFPRAICEVKDVALRDRLQCVYELAGEV